MQLGSAFWGSKTLLSAVEDRVKPMLIETPGGFDFTGTDCRGWMTEAGFSETEVNHLGGPTSMVVGIK